MQRMVRAYSRRSFIGLALSSAAGAAMAAGLPVSLRPELRPTDFHKRAVAGAEALIARSGLTGKVCFAVADVKTGLRLEGGQAHQGMPPASVTKAITALYALDALGAEHRFETTLVATGPVENGVLEGDLILAGGGDPTLDTDGLAEMAQQMKAAGIREVRGAFKVADGPAPNLPTIDPDQPDHVGYSPAVAGIALNFNRVHFGWARSGQSYDVAMDARSSRYQPRVAMATMRVEDRSLPVYTYADRDGRDEWSVARRALGKGGARWLPVRKPGLYAGDVFRTLARSNGIVLSAPELIRTATDGDVIVRYQSDDLLSILRGMLKYSTNITAEMVGLAASYTRAKGVTSLAGSAALMNEWARRELATDKMRLVDHSGLGSGSRMTADAMVTALVKVHRTGVLQPILKPVRMRDAKGRPQADHPIKVLAKTGTLNFVSGLAGYLTAEDGTEMAFAIFAADQDIRAGITRANRDRPEGARTWNRRAKTLQQKLIERWGTLYGT